MKQTVNFNDFCDAFRYMNRYENFSYDGKKALFDYLENYEEQTGQEMELNVIALCCDFTEWDSFEDFKREHNDIETKEEINEHTLFIEIDDDRFITQAF